MRGGARSFSQPHNSYKSHRTQVYNDGGGGELGVFPSHMTHIQMKAWKFSQPRSLYIRCQEIFFFLLFQISYTFILFTFLYISSYFLKIQSIDFHHGPNSILSEISAEKSQQKQVKTSFLFAKGRGEVQTLIKNIKKYVKNMREYEEICQYIGFGHSLIYVGLGTWKNYEHRFHIVSGIWKNSKFSPYMGLGTWKIPRPRWALGLEKIPRRSLLLGSGTQKKFLGRAKK